MKRLLQLMFFLLLFAPIVAFASVYDGTGGGLENLLTDIANSGTVHEIDGKLFTLTATSTKASLTSSSISLTTSEDDCIVKQGYAFCVDSIDQDTDSSVRTVTFRFYRAYPFFQINSTFDDEEFNGSFFPNETQSATLNFQNIGPASAETVELQFPFPNSVKLLSTSTPCKLSGNILTYSGAMDSQKLVTCKYSIRFFSPISYYGSAKVTSHWNNLQYNQTIPVVNFTGESMLNAELFFNSTEVEPGESITFILTLRNPSEQSVNIKPLKLFFPSSFTLKRIASNFKKIDETTLLLSELTLGGGKNSTYSFEFVPKLSETLLIEMESTYTSGGQQGFLKEKSSALSIGASVEPILTTDLDTELGAGQDVLFSVWVENQNPFISYDNLSLKTFTNLTFISDTSLDKLNPLSKKKLLALAFKAPTVDTPQEYTTDFILSYTSQGLHKQVSLQKSVSVTTQGTVIMSLDFDDTTFHAKNWTKFQITLVNSRKDNMENVKVDVSSTHFKLVGKTSFRVDLNAEEEKTLSTIYVQGPDGVEFLIDNITTQLRYQASGTSYSTSAQAQLTLLPPITYNVSPVEYHLSSTRQFQPTPSYLGESYWISYTLENKDTVDFNSITVELPKQEEWDIIGESAFTIDLLPAGSTIVLQQVAELRPKFIGTISLLEDKLSFLRDSALLTNVSANDTFTIANHTFANALQVQRSISVNGQIAHILLTLKNLGADPISYVLSDGNDYSITDTLSDGQIEYEFDVELSPGNYVRAPTEVTYGKYTAYSNISSFTIEEPVLKTADISQNSQLVNEVDVSSQLVNPEEAPPSETLEAVEEVPTSLESPSLISRFMNWIRGWFR